MQYYSVLLIEKKSICLFSGMYSKKAKQEFNSDLCFFSWGRISSFLICYKVGMDKILLLKKVSL